MATAEETFTPPRFSTASGTSSLSAANGSSFWVYVWTAFVSATSAP